MTVEHRLIFELTDIRAITLECRGCKGRFVQDPEHGPNIQENCPICGAPWFAKPTAVRKGVPSPILDIVTSIGKLRQPDNEDLENAGFILRLEFDDPQS